MAKKSKEPIFTWDEQSGLATCILTDGDNVYIGTAQCSEQDQDMKSEKTGCYIAECRAQINYLTHVRDNELKPALKALNILYYSMNQSKQFNSNSYENKMLQRQIHALEFDLTVVKDMLAQEKQNLKEYLNQKAKAYARIRDLRASAKKG